MAKLPGASPVPSPRTRPRGSSVPTAPSRERGGIPDTFGGAARREVTVGGLTRAREKLARKGFLNLNSRFTDDGYLLGDLLAAYALFFAWANADFAELREDPTRRIFPCITEAPRTTARARALRGWAHVAPIVDMDAVKFDFIQGSEDMTNIRSTTTFEASRGGDVGAQHGRRERLQRRAATSRNHGRARTALVACKRRSRRYRPTLRTTRRRKAEVVRRCDADDRPSRRRGRREDRRAGPRLARREQAQPRQTRRSFGNERCPSSSRTSTT